MNNHIHKYVNINTNHKLEIFVKNYMRKLYIKISWQLKKIKYKLNDKF